VDGKLEIEGRKLLNRNYLLLAESASVLEVPGDFAVQLAYTGQSTGQPL